MSKAAPIVLSFVVVFSVLGYIAMDSSSNESNEDYFICDNGQKISSNLQNNGFEDCSDSSDEDVIDHSKHLHADPVLEAILGWIKDTNLRGNAFGPDGKVQKKPPKQHSKESIDLDWCVSKILRAIKKDWRTTYIPLKLRLIPFFKAFWRWYLEFRADQVVEKPK